MTLGRAKILSSENDASVSQNTNINIRIAKSSGNIPQPTNFTLPTRQQTTLSDIQGQTTIPKELSCPATLADEHIQEDFRPEVQGERVIPLNHLDDSLEALKSVSDRQSPFQRAQAIEQSSQAKPFQGRSERGIDFIGEQSCLEERNRMLELLLSVYEDNPLRINNFLVCKSITLMDLIKNLTQADKVELMVYEDS